MNKAAWPFLDPMMVVSIEFKYSTGSDILAKCFFLVKVMPQGIGQPKNLCPDTAILSIGF